jgi:hypothetical protein
MALNKASTVLLGSGSPLDVTIELCIAKEDPVSANSLEDATNFHLLVLNSFFRLSAEKLLPCANSTQIRSSPTQKQLWLSDTTGWQRITMYNVMSNN